MTDGVENVCCDVAAVVKVERRAHSDAMSFLADDVARNCFWCWRQSDAIWAAAVVEDVVEGELDVVVMTSDSNADEDDDEQGILLR